MAVVVELTAEQELALQKAAERLGVTPIALAKAALADLLSKPDDQFDEFAKRVLKKNADLYRRLA